MITSAAKPKRRTCKVVTHFLKIPPPCCWVASAVIAQGCKNVHVSQTSAHLVASSRLLLAKVASWEVPDGQLSVNRSIRQAERGLISIPCRLGYFHAWSLDLAPSCMACHDLNNSSAVAGLEFKACKGCRERASFKRACYCLLVSVG